MYSYNLIHSNRAFKIEPWNFFHSCLGDEYSIRITQYIMPWYAYWGDYSIRAYWWTLRNMNVWRMGVYGHLPDNARIFLVLCIIAALYSFICIKLHMHCNMYFSMHIVSDHNPQSCDIIKAMTSNVTVKTSWYFNI